MILKLVNNLTKNEVILENIYDKQTSNLFYIIDIELPDGLIDGEYSYFLIEDDKILSNGLVQIGDYQSNNTKYNANNKQTIVYNG